MSLRYANFRLRSRILAGDEPPWLRRHIRRGYIVRVILATPSWVNIAEIRRLDKKARALSARTGRAYVLDHVIPITHKRVCGLNVPANLAVVLAGVNAAKSNHWCEWHGELFAEPEQFRLL